MSTNRVQIPFEEIKARVSIHQVAQMLALQMKQSSSQLRGVCPVHGGGERGLAITPAVNKFYCWAAKQGGDQIRLYAHIKSCGDYDAAQKLDEHFRLSLTTPKPETMQPVNTAKPPKAASYDPAAYAARLDVNAPQLSGYDLQPETLKAFMAGYAANGVNKDRLAVALHDREGNPIAHIGQALRDDSPVLKFPNGVDPRAHLFNAHRVHAGELALVRTVIDVMKAYEGGIENAVCFLTEDIIAEQWLLLVSLMDEKQINSVELM